VANLLCWNWPNSVCTGKQSVTGGIANEIQIYIVANKWRISSLLWSAVAICISTRTLLVVFTISSQIHWRQTFCYW
jgi:hypothetical protein